MIGTPVHRARTAVAIDPAIAPSVPPAPTRANSRTPCSRVNTSAMSAHARVISSKFKTLAQTKKTRAAAGLAEGPRKSTKKTTSVAARKR